ncbi:MAG: flagellar export chaperone FliS [Spirochaetaceae bacterium]|nr:flagellar export chaperone FliS [Spirochaetaceae bacterium]RKX78405.1 MAG: flagellar export chaperone FliS [Spirochaetota bacterium]RKX87439.1 MAG: flagellar export chaperone FliS [Spirochaetota bacterium]RKX88826.1 MAG: flagellar export chaperone FliS [Spirochaetota bacterium]
MNTDPLRAYRQTRVKTASQGQLIVMLYNEGLKQLKTAEREFQSSQPKPELVHNAIVKAQDIITELMVSLDFEKGGDIAQNLFHLYMYFNQKLIDVNLSKDASNLHEVYSLMESLRDAWAEIENTVLRQDHQVTAGVNLAG